MKFLDLNYHFFEDATIKKVLEKYRTNFGYLFSCTEKMETVSLFQGPRYFREKIEGVQFLAHKGKQLQKFSLPTKLHKRVASIDPDYILIHGLRYGLYSYFLKRKLKNNPIIMVQAHGYANAPKGLKKYLYKWIDASIDGYIFTGKKNAEDWVANGIFKEEKVIESMEGSTHFSSKDLTIKTPQSYLWVGRLDENKDPLTILNAFEEHVKKVPKATLTMVYNDNQLLDAVISRIRNSALLNERVHLMGTVDKGQMEALYRKHQFFIIGSHYEGSGYSLLEAMACTCIPVVTRIPSHEFMTNNGTCAFLFTPGDKDQLVQKLSETVNTDLGSMQDKIVEQFKSKLSFEAIADDIYKAFELLSKRRS